MPARPIRGPSEAFLAKLRAKYPPGESSESMNNAVRATAKRASEGYVFKTGEEMGFCRSSASDSSGADSPSPTGTRSAS